MPGVVQYPYRNSNLNQAASDFLNISGSRWFLVITSPEASAQRLVRTAGIYGNMFVRSVANTINATPSATFTFRVGGVNQSLTVAVPALGTNGAGYTDNSHTVSVVSGDLISIGAVMGASGANTINPRIVGVSFTASSNTVITQCSSLPGALSTASVTNYLKPSGAHASSTTETGSIQLKSNCAGIRRNMVVVVRTNTWTNPTTVVDRINPAAGGGSANGGLTVTVPANAGAVTYEDNTHSTSILNGDLYNNAWVVGAGSGSLNAQIYVEFETTDATVQYVCAPDSTVYVANAVKYDPFQGDGAAETVEANVQAPIGFAGIIQRSRIYLSANTVTASSTVKVRINGVDGANISVSIPASTSGAWFEDNTHSESVLSTDMVNYKTTPGATGTSFTVQHITSQFQQAASANISVQPSTTVSGVAIAPGVQVQALLGGSVDASFTGAVTASLVSGAGALSGTVTVNAVAGVATFNNLIITGAGPHTLSFSVPGYGTVVSSTFTISNPVTTAWKNSMVTPYGGDPAWLGIGDFRTNVANDGTNRASVISDVRGSISGAMPQLTQATQSKRPGITANGLTFTSLAQSNMISALDTRVDQTTVNALHLLLVAQNPGGSQYLFGVTQDPTDGTSVPYFYHKTTPTSWGAEVNPGPLVANLFTESSDTPIDDGKVRCFVLGKRQTISVPSVATGDCRYRFYPGGRQTRESFALPVASTVAAGMKWALNMLAATFGDMTLQAFAITTQPITGPFLEDFRVFAMAQFGAELDLACRGTIIFDDDSLMRGHNGSHPNGFTANDDGTSSPPSWVKEATSGPGPFSKLKLESNIRAINHANNGRTLLGSIAMLPYHHGTEVDTRRGGNHVIVTSPLINSFHQDYTGVGGDVTAENDMTTFIAGLVAVGFNRIVLYTIADAIWWYTGGVVNQSGLNVMGYNTWVRGPALALPGVAGYVEIEADSSNIWKVNRAGGFSYLDPLYFEGAGIHMTDLGYQLRGGLFRRFKEVNSQLLFGTISRRRRRAA